MKRILIMVWRNILLVPYMWCKLCYHASHPDKYTEEQQYKMLRFITLRANKGGNVHIDVHGEENIPKENVNKIYHMSDVYLIASDYEGTSVSLLEAMYNSMPIISAKSRGLRDMLTDGCNCLMFELHNENDLMRCIIELYEHRELSLQLGTNARASYDKRYNYSNVLSQFKRLL